MTWGRRERAVNVDDLQDLAWELDALRDRAVKAADAAKRLCPSSEAQVREAARLLEMALGRAEREMVQVSS